MGILAGKRALIIGVATDRSIAWGIAQAMHAHGAELAFTYGHEKLKDRVEPLAQSVGSSIVLPLDVTVDIEIDAVFGALGSAWGSLDILVHAVAFCAARGAGRRLCRQHLPGGLCHCARCLQLQPDGAVPGCRAADGRAGWRHPHP